MKSTLEKLSVSGFKSIRELKDFELRNLNIFVGANGAGKSNLIELFRMLSAMAEGGFSKFIQERGGADVFLFGGSKVTSRISAEFTFTSDSSNSQEPNEYRFEATPTVDGRSLLLSEERDYATAGAQSYGSPSEESRIREQKSETSADGKRQGVDQFVFEAISNWMVYHFHDTSETAPMRRYEMVEDNRRLRRDASNIAPFLLDLKTNDKLKSYYKDIMNAVRLVIPFFADFRLDVHEFGAARKVALTWQQKNSDLPMQPYQLSDGSIRFICLATALLQPDPPSIIIIDEPELGLNPEGIAILAELLECAARHTQVIIATQSPELIDYFAIEDIVVVNRKDGQSTFERLKHSDYDVWLEEYSIGELWTKNVIQAGTVHE